MKQDMTQKSAHRPQVPAVSVLIPAAGGSRRMRGTDKLLCRIGGITQIRRIVLGAFATGCPAIVTLPEGNHDRREALAGLDVTILDVPDHAEGMAASLRRGALAARGGAMMVVPADMPDLSGEDLARMCRLHERMPRAILRATSSGLPGHPVLFPADLLGEFGRLSGDAGASAMLSRHADRVVAVGLPGRRATLDLDTPEDWAAWGAPPPQTEWASPDSWIRPDPLGDALGKPAGTVIAVITGTEGPSYRNVGAIMCLFADGTSSGDLTNGCVEADLALHAQAVRRTGRPMRLRYGKGSPFFDIRLPCGGGLDIALFPLGDGSALQDAVFVRQGRAPIALAFLPDGTIRLAPAQPTGWQGEAFILGLRPEPRVMIFGDGPEAQACARLFRAAGFPLRLVTTGSGDAGQDPSPTANSCRTQAQVLADPWTAIVTLFHDHEKEVGILARALTGPAFYVGAQGSKRVGEHRRASLLDAGLTEAEIGRLRAPIGLIPSTRDARSLAVSVLAEVVSASLMIGIAPG